MKQARVILATAIALAGRAALADGLVGTWTITTTNPEGPTVSELVLTKTEDGYAGVISGPRGTAELLSITTDATSFSFIITMQTRLGALELLYSGTIDGDTLTGIIETPIDDRPIIGVRQAKAEPDTSN